VSQNCSLLHFCLSIENALEVLKWLKSALSVVVTVVVSVTTKDILQHLTFYPEKIFLFQLLYNFNRDNCCNCNINNSNIRRFNIMYMNIKYKWVYIISLTFVGICTLLGPIHYKYFCTQYCDKKIKWYYNIWQFLATGFFWPTKVT